MTRLRRRLLLQPLEDRTVPATFTVMNLNDSGVDSLRQCVINANNALGADTIRFKAGLAGILTLISGELSVTGTGALTVQGPGGTKIFLDGNSSGRIFNVSNVSAGVAVNISGLTFINGKSTGNGGAIFADNQNLTLTGCSFLNNSAIQAGGLGGAVAMTAAGTFKATDCNFINNSSAGFGGALYLISDGVSATLVRCDISGNQSSRGGGALVYGNLLMDSCSVASNQATGGDGGGLILQYTQSASAVAIRNSTISGNVAQTSIIFGNVNATAPDISSANKVSVKTSVVSSSAGYNETDLGGNLPDGVDIKLGPLADNGGPTFTHQPAWDSPLVEAGSNPTTRLTDQRGNGFLRVIGENIDIGAFEVVNLVVHNTADSGLGSLRQTILHANSHPGLDQITFDPAAFGTIQRTITLSSELSIGGETTIVGVGQKLLTLSGNNACRIFNLEPAPANSQINLFGMTIANGSAPQGGAIVGDNEILTLDSCIVMGNFASTGSGGAIYMAENGNVSCINSTLNNNKTDLTLGTGEKLGGAVSAFHLQIVASSISGISTTIGVGIAVGSEVNSSNAPFSLSIEASTIDHNRSYGGGGMFIGGGDGIGTFLIRNTTISSITVHGGDGGGIAQSNIADLVIGTDGRYSTVRKRGPFTELPSPQHFDILNFHVPFPDFWPDRTTVRLELGPGCITGGIPTADGRLWVGMTIQKGQYKTQHAAGPDGLTEDLLHRTSPDLAAHLRANAEALKHPVLLNVIVGRLETWTASGLLLLGDAAHPMSPIGGQGINVALRDALVAANHLCPVLTRGNDYAAIDAAARQVAAERMPEIVTIQDHQRKQSQTFLRSDPMSSRLAMRLLPLLAQSGLLRGLMRKRLRALQHGVVPVRLTE